MVARKVKCKAIRKWESLYTGRTTYSGQLGGTHTLQEDINKVDWTAGYAFAAYREPDRKMRGSIDETKTKKKSFYRIITSPIRCAITRTEGSRCCECFGVCPRNEMGEFHTEIDAAGGGCGDKR